MSFNVIINTNNYKIYQNEVKSVYQNFQYMQYMLSTLERNTELHEYYRLKVENYYDVFCNALECVELCEKVVKNNLFVLKINKYKQKIMKVRKLIDWYIKLQEISVNFEPTNFVTNDLNNCFQRNSQLITILAFNEKMYGINLCGIEKNKNYAHLIFGG